METCEYGCGQEARFTLKNKKLCCSKHYNKCLTIRQKNSEGLKRAYANEKRVRCTFTDEQREKSNRLSIARGMDNSFQSGSYATNKTLKRYLVDYYNVKLECSECGIVEWRDKKIEFQLDHIDGNSSNNLRENLRLLCPNCHSQTDTFCGKSINTGKHKVTDEQLIECLKSTANIRQGLIKAGLTPKGANYSRAYKLSAQIERSDVEPVKFGETFDMATPSQA